MKVGDKIELKTGILQAFINGKEVSVMVKKKNKTWTYTYSEVKTKTTSLSLVKDKNGFYV